MMSLLRRKVRRLRYLLRALVKLVRGSGDRHCPICGFKGRFMAIGVPIRSDAQCPKCRSLERHRLFLLLLQREPPIGGSTRLLHFAPEKALTGLLAERVATYHTADVMGSKADLKLDITAMPDIETGSYDAVLCSHVLEHVDDRAALAELFRILKPGGMLIAMAPICEGWKTTYENPAVTNPADRAVHFGQHDHLRWYGRDIRDRINAAGFILTEFTAGGEDAVRYALHRGETVFLARKPGAP